MSQTRIPCKAKSLRAKALVAEQEATAETEKVMQKLSRKTFINRLLALIHCSEHLQKNLFVRYCIAAEKNVAAVCNHGASSC